MVDAEAGVHAGEGRVVGVGEARDIDEIALFAIEEQADFDDGFRLAGRQVFDVDGEYAATREVREHVAAVERRNAGAAIDVAAADGEAFVVVVLRHRIDEAWPVRFRQRIHRAEPCAVLASGGEGAFAQPPAVVGAGDAQIHLFQLILADVADEHAAVRIPGELLRMAQPIGPDLARRALRVDERIAGGNAVALAVRAAERIDAGNRAERRRQALGVVAGIVRGPAIAEADVQQPVVLVALPGGWIEGDGADVVVRRELADAQHLAGRSGKDPGARVVRRPLAEHALLDVRRVLGVVGDAALGAGVERRVELAVARRVGNRELRMEGEAHEARLVREGGAVEADVLRAQIQVHARRRAVGIRQVQHAADVVEGETRRAGHGNQVLDARVGVVGAAGAGRIFGLGRAHEGRRRHRQRSLLDPCRQRIVNRLLRAGRRGERRQRRQQDGPRRVPCRMGHLDLRLRAGRFIIRKPRRQ